MPSHSFTWIGYPLNWNLLRKSCWSNGFQGFLAVLDRWYLAALRDTGLTNSANPWFNFPSTTYSFDNVFHSKFMDISLFDIPQEKKFGNLSKKRIYPSFSKIVFFYFEQIVIFCVWPKICFFTWSFLPIQKNIQLNIVANRVRYVLLFLLSKTVSFLSDQLGIFYFDYILIILHLTKICFSTWIHIEYYKN